MEDIDEIMLKIFSITVGWVIFYFIGAFIAWELNPLNWWLFTSGIGRGLFIIFFIFSIVAGFNDDYYN